MFPKVNAATIGPTNREKKQIPQSIVCDRDHRVRDMLSRYFESSKLLLKVVRVILANLEEPINASTSFPLLVAVWSWVATIMSKEEAAIVLGKLNTKSSFQCLHIP